MSDSRRGCLVAAVVAGSALLALGLSWHFHFLPKWRRLLASNTAFEIERRLEAHHRLFGQWPQGSNTDILLALRGRNPGNTPLVSDRDGFPIAGNAFVDQWGSPIVFSFDGDGRPRATSPGPNRRPGDADDIDSSAARADARRQYGDNIPPFEPQRSTSP
jgi:hypothetical protein